MSYQQKNITIAMLSHLLIGAYYGANMVQMVNEGDLVARRVFGLWAVVIVAIIIVNIFASALIHLAFAIVYAIRTKASKPERHMADERDELIALKGRQVSYFTLSIGVFIAIVAFGLAMPALTAFSLIISCLILAEITGDISKLYLYQKGT